jgi:hypothetical protein
MSQAQNVSYPGKREGLFYPANNKKFFATAFDLRLARIYGQANTAAFTDLDSYGAGGISTYSPVVNRSQRQKTSFAG